MIDNKIHPESMLHLVKNHFVTPKRKKKGCAHEFHSSLMHSTQKMIPVSKGTISRIDITIIGTIEKDFFRIVGPISFDFGFDR